MRGQQVGVLCGSGVGEGMGRTRFLECGGDGCYGGWGDEGCGCGMAGGYGGGATPDGEQNMGLMMKRALWGSCHAN